MNILQKVWVGLRKKSHRRKLEARWCALGVARQNAAEARFTASEGLKQPYQSKTVREYNNKIKEYRTEQLQIEALLRDMK